MKFEFESKFDVGSGVRHSKKNKNGVVLSIRFNAGSFISERSNNKIHTIIYNVRFVDGKEGYFDEEELVPV